MLDNNDDTKRTRVTVDILGDTYSFLGDSPPEYIEMIARHVDEELKTLRKKQPRLARSRLLVLALMNIAERFFDEREKGDRLQDDNRKLKRDIKVLERQLKERKGRA